MTDSFRFAPSCAVCGRSDTSAEILAPGDLPQQWETWPEDRREGHLESTDPEQWRLLYVGLTGTNGDRGDTLPGGEDEARKLIAMLTPFDPVAVRRKWYDSLGYCEECGTFYCYGHWRVSATGFGWCPQGHGRSLDPHWSPEW